MIDQFDPPGGIGKDPFKGGNLFEPPKEFGDAEDPFKEYEKPAKVPIQRQLPGLRSRAAGGVTINPQTGEPMIPNPVAQEMPGWFKVARLIDAPGRTVRSGILAAFGEGEFGRDVWKPPEEGNVVGGSSGWDIMEKIFGYKDTPGKFDWVDAGAIAVEILTDPLTWVLGGFGLNSKAGDMGTKLLAAERNAITHANAAVLSRKLATRMRRAAPTTRKRGLSDRVIRARARKGMPEGEEWRRVSDTPEQMMLSPDEITSLGRDKRHQAFIDRHELQASKMEAIALEEYQAAERYRKALHEVGKSGLIKGAKPLDIKKLLSGQHKFPRDTLSGKPEIDKLINRLNHEDLARQFYPEGIGDEGLNSLLKRIPEMGEFELASLFGKGTTYDKSHDLLGRIGASVQEAAGYEVFLAKQIARGEITRPNALLTVGLPRMPVPNKYWPARVVGRLGRMGFGTGHFLSVQALEKLHRLKILPKGLYDRLKKVAFESEGKRVGYSRFMKELKDWHGPKIIKGETTVALKDPRLEFNPLQKSGEFLGYAIGASKKGREAFGRMVEHVPMRLMRPMFRSPAGVMGTGGFMYEGLFGEGSMDPESSFFKRGLGGFATWGGIGAGMLAKGAYRGKFIPRISKHSDLNLQGKARMTSIKELFRAPSSTVPQEVAAHQEMMMRMQAKGVGDTGDMVQAMMAEMGELPKIKDGTYGPEDIINMLEADAGPQLDTYYIYRESPQKGERIAVNKEELRNLRSVSTEKIQSLTDEIADLTEQRKALRGKRTAARIEGREDLITQLTEEMDRLSDDIRSVDLQRTELKKKGTRIYIDGRGQQIHVEVPENIAKRKGKINEKNIYLWRKIFYEQDIGVDQADVISNIKKLPGNEKLSNSEAMEYFHRYKSRVERRRSTLDGRIRAAAEGQELSFTDYLNKPLMKRMGDDPLAVKTVQTQRQFIERLLTDPHLWDAESRQFITELRGILDSILFAEEISGTSKTGNFLHTFIGYFPRYLSDKVRKGLLDNANDMADYFQHMETHIGNDPTRISGAGHSYTSARSLREYLTSDIEVGHLLADFKDETMNWLNKKISQKIENWRSNNRNLLNSDAVAANKKMRIDIPELTDLMEAKAFEMDPAKAIGQRALVSEMTQGATFLQQNIILSFAKSKSSAGVTGDVAITSATKSSKRWDTGRANNYPAMVRKTGDDDLDGFTQLFKDHGADIENLSAEQLKQVDEVGFPALPYGETNRSTLDPRGMVIPSVDEFLRPGGIESPARRAFYYGLVESPLIEQGIIGTPELALIRTVLNDMEESVFAGITGRGGHPTSIMWQILPEDYAYYGAHLRYDIPNTQIVDALLSGKAGTGGVNIPTSGSVGSRSRATGIPFNDKSATTAGHIFGLHPRLKNMPTGFKVQTMFHEILHASFDEMPEELVRAFTELGRDIKARGDVGTFRDTIKAYIADIRSEASKFPNNTEVTREIVDDLIMKEFTEIHTQLLALKNGGLKGMRNILDDEAGAAMAADPNKAHLLGGESPNYSYKEADMRSAILKSKLMELGYPAHKLSGTNLEKIIAETPPDIDSFMQQVIGEKGLYPDGAHYLDQRKRWLQAEIELQGGPINTGTGSKIDAVGIHERWEQFIEEMSYAAASSPSELFATLGAMILMKKRVPRHLADDPRFIAAFGNIGGKTVKRLKNTFMARVKAMMAPGKDYGQQAATLREAQEIGEQSLPMAPSLESHRTARALPSNINPRDYGAIEDSIKAISDRLKRYHKNRKTPGAGATRVVASKNIRQLESRLDALKNHRDALRSDRGKGRSVKSIFDSMTDAYDDSTRRTSSPEPSHPGHQVGSLATRGEEAEWVNSYLDAIVLHTIGAKGTMDDMARLINKRRGGIPARETLEGNAYEVEEYFTRVFWERTRDHFNEYSRLRREIDEISKLDGSTLRRKGLDIDELNKAISHELEAIGMIYGKIVGRMDSLLPEHVISNGSFADKVKNRGFMGDIPEGIDTGDILVRFEDEFLEAHKASGYRFPGLEVEEAVPIGEAQQPLLGSMQAKYKDMLTLDSLRLEDTLDNFTPQMENLFDEIDLQALNFFKINKVDPAMSDLERFVKMSQAPDMTFPFLDRFDPASILQLRYSLRRLHEQVARNSDVDISWGGGGMGQGGMDPYMGMAEGGATGIGPAEDLLSSPGRPPLQGGMALDDPASIANAIATVDQYMLGRYKISMSEKLMDSIPEISQLYWAHVDDFSRWHPRMARWMEEAGIANPMFDESRAGAKMGMSLENFAQDIMTGFEAFDRGPVDHLSRMRRGDVEVRNIVQEDGSIKRVREFPEDPYVDFMMRLELLRETGGFGGPNGSAGWAAHELEEWARRKWNEAGWSGGPFEESIESARNQFDKYVAANPDDAGVEYANAHFKILDGSEIRVLETDGVPNIGRWDPGLSVSEADRGRFLSRGLDTGDYMGTEGGIHEVLRKDLIAVNRDGITEDLAWLYKQWDGEPTPHTSSWTSTKKLTRNQAAEAYRGYAARLQKKARKLDEVLKGDKVVHDRVSRSWYDQHLKYHKMLQGDIDAAMSEARRIKSPPAFSRVRDLSDEFGFLDPEADFRYVDADITPPANIAAKIEDVIERGTNPDEISRMLDDISKQLDEDIKAVADFDESKQSLGFEEETFEEISEEVYWYIEAAEGLQSEIKSVSEHMHRYTTAAGTDRAARVAAGETKWPTGRRTNLKWHHLTPADKELVTELYIEYLNASRKASNHEVFQGGWSQPSEVISNKAWRVAQRVRKKFFEAKRSGPNPWNLDTKYQRVRQGGRRYEGQLQIDSHEADIGRARPDEIFMGEDRVPLITVQVERFEQALQKAIKKYGVSKRSGGHGISKSDASNIMPEHQSALHKYQSSGESITREQLDALVWSRVMSHLQVKDEGTAKLSGTVPMEATQTEGLDSSIATLIRSEYLQGRPIEKLLRQLPEDQQRSFAKTLMDPEAEGRLVDPESGDVTVGMGEQVLPPFAGKDLGGGKDMTHYRAGMGAFDSATLRTWFNEMWGHVSGWRTRHGDPGGRKYQSIKGPEFGDRGIQGTHKHGLVPDKESGYSKDTRVRLLAGRAASEPESFTPGTTSGAAQHQELPFPFVGRSGEAHLLRFPGLEVEEAQRLAGADIIPEEFLTMVDEEAGRMRREVDEIYRAYNEFHGDPNSKPPSSFQKDELADLLGYAAKPKGRWEFAQGDVTSTQLLKNFMAEDYPRFQEAFRARLITALGTKEGEELYKALSSQDAFPPGTAFNNFPEDEVAMRYRQGDLIDRPLQAGQRVRDDLSPQEVRDAMDIAGPMPRDIPAFGMDDGGYPYVTAQNLGLEDPLYTPRGDGPGQMTGGPAEHFNVTPRGRFLGDDAQSIHFFGDEQARELRRRKYMGERFTALSEGEAKASSLERIYRMMLHERLNSFKSGVAKNWNTAISARPGSFIEAWEEHIGQYIINNSRDRAIRSIEPLQLRWEGLLDEMDVDPRRYRELADKADELLHDMFKMNELETKDILKRTADKFQDARYRKASHGEGQAEYLRSLESLSEKGMIPPTGISREGLFGTSEHSIRQMLPRGMGDIWVHTPAYKGIIDDLVERTYQFEEGNVFGSGKTEFYDVDENYRDMYVTENNKNSIRDQVMVDLARYIEKELPSDGFTDVTPKEAVSAAVHKWAKSRRAKIDKVGQRPVESTMKEVRARGEDIMDRWLRMKEHEWGISEKVDRIDTYLEELALKSEGRPVLIGRDPEVQEVVDQHYEEFLDTGNELYENFREIWTHEGTSRKDKKFMYVSVMNRKRRGGDWGATLPVADEHYAPRSDFLTAMDKVDFDKVSGERAIWIEGPPMHTFDDPGSHPGMTYDEAVEWFGINYDPIFDNQGLVSVGKGQPGETGLTGKALRSYRRRQGLALKAGHEKSTALRGEAKKVFQNTFDELDKDGALTAEIAWMDKVAKAVADDNVQPSGSFHPDDPIGHSPLDYESREAYDAAVRDAKEYSWITMDDVDKFGQRIRGLRENTGGYQSSEQKRVGTFWDEVSLKDKRAWAINQNGKAPWQMEAHGPFGEPHSGPMHHPTHELYDFNAGVLEDATDSFGEGWGLDPAQRGTENFAETGWQYREGPSLYESAVSKIIQQFYLPKGVSSIDGLDQIVRSVNPELLNVYQFMLRNQFDIDNLAQSMGDIAAPILDYHQGAYEGVYAKRYLRRRRRPQERSTFGLANMQRHPDAAGPPGWGFDSVTRHMDDPFGYHGAIEGEFSPNSSHYPFTQQYAADFQAGREFESRYLDEPSHMAEGTSADAGEAGAFKGPPSEDAVPAPTGFRAGPMSHISAKDKAAFEILTEFLRGEVMDKIDVTDLSPAGVPVTDEPWTSTLTAGRGGLQSSHPPQWLSASATGQGGPMTPKHFAMKILGLSEESINERIIDIGWGGVWENAEKAIYSGRPLKDQPASPVSFGGHKGTNMKLSPERLPQQSNPMKWDNQGGDINMFRNYGDPEEWWAGSMGYSSVDQIPAHLSVRPLSEGNVEKYIGQLLKYKPDNLTPEEFRTALSGLEDHLLEARVNPARARLYASGQLEGKIGRAGNLPQSLPATVFGPDPEEIAAVSAQLRFKINKYAQFKNNEMNGLTRGPTGEMVPVPPEVQKLAQMEMATLHEQIHADLQRLVDLDFQSGSDAIKKEMASMEDIRQADDEVARGTGFENPLGRPWTRSQTEIDMSTGPWDHFREISTNAQRYFNRSSLGEMAAWDDEIYDILGQYKKRADEPLSWAAEDVGIGPRTLLDEVDSMEGQFGGAYTIGEEEIAAIRKANRGELPEMELRNAMKSQLSILPEDKASSVFRKMATNVIQARGSGFDPTEVAKMEKRIRAALGAHLDEEALAGGGPMYVYDGTIWPRPEELDALSRTSDVRTFPQIAHADTVQNSSWAMSEDTIPLSEYVRDAEIYGFPSPKDSDVWVPVPDRVTQEKVGPRAGLGQGIERDPFHDQLVDAGLGYFDDNNKFVDNYHIPTSVSKHTLNMKKKMFTPSSLRGLAKYINSTNGWLKGHLTRWFPSFYFRNLISDSGLSWSSNAVDIGVIPDAWTGGFGATREFHDEFLAKHPLFDSPADLVKEIEQRGGFRGTRVDEILRHAEGSQFGSDFDNFMRTLNKAAGQADKPVIKQTKFALKALLSMGMPDDFTPIIMKMNLTQIMELPERITRTAHVMARMKKGDTFLEGLRHMKKHLLDYSDLTEFEKKVMSQARMFYTWHRKVLPLTFQNMAEHPGRYAALSRMHYNPSMRRDIDHDGQPVYLPEHVRKKSGMKFGTGESATYFTDPGFHFSELNFIDPGGPTGMSPWELVRNFLGGNVSSMQPWVKAAMEQAVNTDFFTGRKLSEMTQASWQHGATAAAWDSTFGSIKGWPKTHFQTLGEPGKGKAFWHQADHNFLRMHKIPPLSRHFSEWPRFADALWEDMGWGDPDPRVPSDSQWIRGIMGMKFDPATPERSLAAEQFFWNRKIEEEALERGIGSTKLYFLKKQMISNILNKFPGMAPEEQKKAMKELHQSKDYIDLYEALRETRRQMRSAGMYNVGGDDDATREGGMIEVPEAGTPEAPRSGGLFER